MGSLALIAVLCLLVYLQHKRAKGLRAVAEKAQKTLEEQARTIILKEGYYISSECTVKILEADLDGDREALFRGRWRGDDRMKLAADSADECYTLVWREEGTSFVSVGW